MEDRKSASKKNPKSLGATENIGVSLAIWRQIAKSRECSPEMMLEIYFYARDPAYLDLLRGFASLPPADQLAVQHILKRLVRAKDAGGNRDSGANAVLTH